MGEREGSIRSDGHMDEARQRRELPEAFRARPAVSKPVAETVVLTPEQIIRDANQMEAIVSDTESFVGHEAQ